MDILPSSVHPPETIRQPIADADRTGDLTTDERSVCFRHSGWEPVRNRVHIAMLATGQSDNRVRAFSECGSHAWVAWSKSDPSKFCVTSDKCHDRFCVPCSNEQAARVARGLAAFAAKRTIRFATLTLKTNGEPLRDSLDRLAAAFRRLRSREYWKQHVTGGAAFLEVTWNEEKQRWHPHLHILLEGRYMEHTLLRDEWHAATGDSWIVHIQALKKHEHGIAYVSKYASKGFDSSILKSPAVLGEAMLALAGRRLMTCFKSWRGFKLVDKENPQDWEPLAPLAQIRTHAQDGDPWAIRLLEHLRNPNEVDSPGPPPDYLRAVEVSGCSRGPLASHTSHLTCETTADSRRVAAMYLDQHHPGKVA